MRSVTRGAAANTKVIFIAGMQRSGTTLLMDVMHYCPDVEVFDEAPNTQVFKDYRIRSTEILRDSVARSRFGHAAYKVICDSHIIEDLIRAVPEVQIVWAYREARDNAESQLRKFENATRAIRLVCAGEPGGGWFAEGISASVGKRVRDIDTSEFSEFDFACLVWWARNQLFFEKGLDQSPNVRTVSYADLAANPNGTLKKMFDWTGLDWSDRYARFVHSRSLGKRGLPPLAPQVAELCDELYARFEDTRRLR